jgi:hypothetical protein
LLPLFFKVLITGNLQFDVNPPLPLTSFITSSKVQRYTPNPGRSWGFVLIASNAVQWKPTILAGISGGYITFQVGYVPETALRGHDGAYGYRDQTSEGEDKVYMVRNGAGLYLWVTPSGGRL